jgi:membrane-associated phospholipid phosphatase
VKLKRLNTCYKKVWSIIYLLIDFIICNILVLMFLMYFKALVGRFRPDFINRCGPKDPKKLGIYDPADCNNSDQSVLKEGQYSYPSAHSTLAFAHGIYTTLYLFWNYYVRQSPSNRTLIGAYSSQVESVADVEQNAPERTYHCVSDILRLLQFSSLLLGPAAAFFIAITRVLQYKHTFSDINAGALIGTLYAALIGFKSFFLYEKFYRSY